MKTIHEIIDMTAVVLQVTDVAETRRVLREYKTALKEMIPPTAIICDTKDSVVVSKKTARAARFACDWLMRDRFINNDWVVALRELSDALKGDTTMGIEKMDSGVGCGEIGGYPSNGELAKCAPMGTRENPPTSRDIAVEQLAKVILELWNMYEQESDSQTKLTLLYKIAEAAVTLHNMKGE